MNKQIAIALLAKARDLAERMSNPERAKNANGETFKVHRIIPTSERTAKIVYRKSSGKLAGAFAIYIDAGTPYWIAFFMHESHILGMSKVADFLQEIEEFNLPLNFADGSPREMQPKRAATGVVSNEQWLKQFGDE